MRLRTVDYHTGGEPFRIVTGGVEPPRGRDDPRQRRDALERLDHVRRLLVYEPRGHADMYGCFVVEPNDDGADLGVVFFHNAGYSTACGHGTIALVTWALDEGIVERREGENRVVVDVPSGRLETWAQRRGRPRALRPLPERAVVRLGARRARLPAARSTSPSAARSTPARRSGSSRRELPRLIELGRELKRDARGASTRSCIRSSPSSATSTASSSGRTEGEAPLPSGTSPSSPTARSTARLRQRHVGPARAPRRRRAGCRAARSCATCRIVGTEFTGRVVGEAEVAGRPAVVTEVEGQRLPDGERDVQLDPDDPLGDGFLLR